MGLDGDVAGLAVRLDRAALTPAQAAVAWPDVFIIRTHRIYRLTHPRPITKWETGHTTHQCEEPR